MNFIQSIKGAKKTLVMLPAVLLLQLALGLYYWLPPLSLRLAFRPSPDAFLIIALLLLAAQLGFSKKKATVLIRYILTPIIGLSIPLGIAQTISTREFSYDFTLAYHLNKIKALLKMMYEAQSTAAFALSIALLLAILLLIMFLASWAMRRIYNLGYRKPTASLTPTILVLTSYFLFASLLSGVHPWISLKVFAQISETINKEEHLQKQAKIVATKIKSKPTILLKKEAQKPTVLVFVVESYGQILFESDKYKNKDRDFYKTIESFEAKLSAQGYYTASAAYTAPVFGGSSWLANASILCRLPVPTEKIYFSLFKTKSHCLPRPFNDANYESVFAGSNTTHIPDDYAALFPFEHFFTKDTFDYQGPRMSWSYMPDQYVIDQVEQKILSQSSERPRFVYYKLSSSHHPWDTIPAFIKDWSKVGNGILYHRTKSIRYPDNGFIGGTHYNEGYYDSIVYSLQVVFDYLLQMPQARSPLVIILGDHQPRHPVALSKRDPWTIPLHVLSKDASLIERFKKYGYRQGLMPPSSAEAKYGLDSIADHLFLVLNNSSE